MRCISVTRRHFLQSASAGWLAGWPAMATLAGDQPSVTNPRATLGDNRYEPDWEQQLTVTVGPDKADLVGRDDKVIQAACDYVARLGGGTVQLLPGEYRFRNAVFLPSKIRLRGSGDDSRIIKTPSETIELSHDSDWYDQEVTLKKSGQFRVGDGVVLRAKNAHHGGAIVLKRTLIARSGNRFKLDRGLKENLWMTGSPTCASLFPLLTSERTSDVVIENLTLDGNAKQNDHLDGNHAGCIFLQECNNYQIRQVTARNYNGDGISFQICHDVTVEDCHSHDNQDLGVHPGSGSQRPRLLNNRLERNSQGIFWCWGVKFGLAEGNLMDGNRRYGMSIGHCDTDNLIRNNVIRNSGEIGLLFRDDPRGQDFWPNRNQVRDNRLIDNGGKAGVAIDITGQPKQLQLSGNQLEERRGPAQRCGIRIGPDVGAVMLAENKISGFATQVQDLRLASKTK